MCEGVGAYAGYVFVCSGLASVAKVDPDTFEVVADLPIKKQGSQGHMPGGFGHVWVLTSDGSGLAGINPEKFTRSTSPTRSPVVGVDVTVGPTGLWVPCTVDDQVVLVDPQTGDTTVQAEIANPVEVAADPNDPDQVWVGTTTAVVQLDPRTGRPTTIVDGGASNGGVAVADGLVWIRSDSGDFLSVLDQQTGKLIARVSSNVPGGGDVVLLDGDVWTTAYEESALYRLDATLVRP